MNANRAAALTTVVVGVLALVYFVADETPSATFVRVAYAGAIVAGMAAVLYAVAYLAGNRHP